MYDELLDDLELDIEEIQECLNCPYPECIDCKAPSFAKKAWDFSKFTTYSSVKNKKLTAIERAVVDGVLDGLNDIEIAERSGYYRGTIQRIRKMMNLPTVPKNRQAGVRKAFGYAWSKT